MGQRPVAILGAGLAGLTAAVELKRLGFPVVVFEAGGAAGGMAASYKDAAGFSYDYGAHFISNRLAEALGGLDRCTTVRRYGESVSVAGQTYAHPFGLLRNPRYVASAMRQRMRRDPIRSAADHFTAAYGPALASEVAIPIAEAWSGAAAGELAPAVGEKFGAGILKSLYLSAASRVTRRAVCNGYTREMPESAKVWHVYPKGGLSTLLDPMVRELGDAVRLRSPVETIVVEGPRVVAVRAKGETIPVSAAISTAPVNVLPKIVEGTDALDHLAAFRYRPMVFVNLRFEGRGLLPNTMLWVPDRAQPFFRLTEAPLSMPWLAPEGRTLITFDLGCEVGDEIWTMDEARLETLCLDGLRKLLPEAADRCLGLAGIVRTAVSYPVFLKSYEEDRLRWAQGTGVEGLWSVGRNGEFAHILMEDVYWRTKRRMAEVATYVEGAFALHTLARERAAARQAAARGARSAA